MKHCVRALLLASVVAVGHAVHAQRGAEILESKALQNLKEGRARARAQSYGQALADLRVAVALAEQMPGANLTLALALHNLAEVHRLLNEPATALQAYRRALGIYEELNHEFAAEVTQTQISTLLSGPDDDLAQSSARSAETTVPVEKRLNRINEAVERIRERLRSRDGGEAAGPARKSSGAVELVEPSSDPDRRAYAEAVREKIESGWNYPVSAKNKHQEGTVELEFAIVSDGEIDSIRILKSSGFLPLDMESIRSVREAAPFGTVVLPAGEPKINLRLAFRYTLPTSDRFKAQAAGSGPSDR